jgi:hypothetical protein
VMVIGLVIDFWGIGKGSTKKQGWKKWWMGGGRSIRATGFYGPCVCLGVFVLLEALLGTAIVYSWYSRLVSGWCVCRREG